MKKILITIGLLLILATGVAIFMEENAKTRTLLTNPIGNEEDIKKAAEEYEERQKEMNTEDSLSGSWMWQSSVDASGETIAPADSSSL